MAKRKYEVITKGLTVFGAKFGEIVELDEATGERFVAARYVKESRKHNADVKAEPTELEGAKEPEQPKAEPKKTNRKKATDK